MTFERGFERDPMGSYLDSLDRVAALGPELVLPGHGPPFRDGARRAATIARGKRRRLDQVRELVEPRGERTVTEITAELFRGRATGAQRHFAMAEILADLAFHEVRGALERMPPAGRRVRVADAEPETDEERSDGRDRPSDSGTAWSWSAAGSAGSTPPARWRTPTST